MKKLGKKAEQQIQSLNEILLQQVEEISAVNKELEAFSYSVSHDLRAPLRAVDGFSRILLEEYGGKLDSEGHRLLNVIRANTQRMGLLIDDLLTFSRTSRQEIIPSKINMHSLVLQTIEEVKKSNPERTVSILIGDLPQANGSAPMIKQVWVNLISNAFKFTRYVLDPSVEIGSAKEPGENVYWVKDNGAGFDMRYANKLFNVFQRLHGDEEFDGTGVGLALVQRIVSRHRGRVWAEGKVNEGAIFYFTLPS